ncbi:hypothetical protein EH243_14395 [Amphritea opalescens]|uniref:Porin n=1 Tax=Amphritea opalescens TaxID=2490544 RepID=A0A430KNK4_9GAMM|nr:hypothetical protein [Amphritea opalescens]RTE65044.1 hypothetical protein EH243_14370 [Amphritea opalescens]RTE65045.1 hypothetical protein EH243_14375 [Amphritea opalescens]RTE65049.1 hypothetical protein EH243_14395 [Amphritea opalescens]
MKALITTIALASTLAAGTASATNFEVGQLGGGTTIQNGSHYSSEELVTVDHANLPANHYGSELFIGSK